jgi:OFA family oxalate/formate antiporter-like MFS transporter
MGVVIGVGVLVGALVLRDPPTGWLDGGESEGDGDDGSEVGGRQYTWREMLRTWQFPVMYLMFVCMSGAGLMLTAKVVSFAQNLGLAAVIATASATLLPVAGGVGRLLLGEVSDRVKRERAMFVAFLLCGLGLYAVVYFAEAGRELAFVAAVVVATFFWSPQYTLFPSVVGDYYGREHSSANYALLYSGKMWGGVFGGTAASALVTATGWTTTFLLGGTLALVAALCALVLRSPR